MNPFAALFTRLLRGENRRSPTRGQREDVLGGLRTAAKKALPDADGYVTAARNAGQPKDVTGERVNMSGEVLDKHYDKGSSAEKAERR